MEPYLSMISLHESKINFYPFNNEFQQFFNQFLTHPLSKSREMFHLLMILMFFNLVSGSCCHKVRAWYNKKNNAWHQNSRFGYYTMQTGTVNGKAHYLADDGKNKDIQIVLRLFLVIAVYCQCSSSQIKSITQPPAFIAG